MNKPAIFIYAIVLASLAAMGAGYDEILSDKNRQKDYLIRQINECYSKISNDSLIETELAERIDSNATLYKTITEFLENYRNERYLSAGQISSETDSIISLESEVEQTQKSLRSKIINLYKHGKNYELELLLSARSPNELLRRNQYLQKFAQTRRKELQDLKNKRFILEEKKQLVNLSTSSRRFYVEARRIQAKQLEDTLKALEVLRDETQYESKLNAYKIDKMNSELVNIEDYISNFTAYKPSFAGTKSSRINYASENMDNLKGSLNPPSDISLIRNTFGNSLNNTTGTIIFNNGVDFSLAFGSKVYSVAQGTVSIIGDIPFYGKVVVITHDNNYHTLYACLSEVSVKAGDKVRLNQVIGKSGEDPEGQILHFEIWHDKTPLNPKEWLRF